MLGSGDGDAIVVGDGVAVSGIDGLLPPVSGITGRWRGTGSPRAGIDVRVYEIASGRLAGKTGHHTDGTFAVLDLPLGSYHVRFSDPASALALQWFGGSASESGATTVTVSHFVNSIADASLAAAGTISGTVTGSGSGLGGTSVHVYPLGGGRR